MISKVLLTTLFLVNNVYSQICILEYNIDYAGNDIKDITGTIEECCTLCDRLDNCVVYTWSDFNSGTCWLKNSINGRVQKNGTISSILSSPSGSGSKAANETINTPNSSMPPSGSQSNKTNIVSPASVPPSVPPSVTQSDNTDSPSTQNNALKLINYEYIIITMLVLVMII